LRRTREEERRVRTHITRLLVVALAFLLASLFFKHNFSIASEGGITHHWASYLIDAVAFGILNMTVGLVLRLFTLPLRILTLGLFTIVINAILILIMRELPASTYVKLHTNVAGAFEAAVTISVVSLLAEIAGFTRKHVVKK
jgi:putative membrane protein